MARRKNSSNVYRFGVSMEPHLVKIFDEYVNAAGFRNRSEAIRELIRKQLTHSDFDTFDGEAVSVISVFYNRVSHDVLESLGKVEQDYSGLIRSRMVIPLRNDNYVEVLEATGEGRLLQEIISRFRVIDGVQYVNAAVVPCRYLAEYGLSSVLLHEKNPLHDIIDNYEFAGEEQEINGLLDLLADYTLSGKTLLDAGCGSGVSTEAFLNIVHPGGRVIGVDFSHKALAQARKRVGARAELRHEDLLQMSLATDSVDVVVCHNTFWTLLDRAAFLREMRRILRPNGLLVVFDTREGFKKVGIPGVVRPVKATSKEIFRLLSASGLLLDNLGVDEDYYFTATTPSLMNRSREAGMPFSERRSNAKDIDH